MISATLARQVREALLSCLRTTFHLRDKGLGSGKTECFLYPILDHAARAARQGERGIKALVHYPMNALATDQAARFVEEVRARTPGLNVGLYVGGKPSGATPEGLMVDRERMRERPPDILLAHRRTGARSGRPARLENAAHALAGRVEWRITSPTYRWRLIPQRDLGPPDGVKEPCRPDYVLDPVEPIAAESGPASRNGRGAPHALAIFCDGRDYHVQPKEAVSRLGDDVKKRRAILGSSRYRVWSVGWKDLDDFRGDQPYRDGLLIELPPTIAARAKGLGPGDLLTWQSGPVKQLLEYMEDPTPSRWAQRAVRP